MQRHTLCQPILLWFSDGAFFQILKLLVRMTRIWKGVHQIKEDLFMIDDTHKPESSRCLAYRVE